MHLRIYQVGAYLGDLARNVEAHATRLRTAAAEGVDVVVFPELALTGYLLRDLAPTVARRPHDMCAMLAGALGNLARPLEFFDGFALRDRDHRLYNAYGHFRVEPGAGVRLLGLHRKVNLPDYGMFEEQRYFCAGRRLRAHDSPLLGRVGMLLCEDAWRPANLLPLVLDGPDLVGAGMLFVGANSPARAPARGAGVPRNVETWRNLARLYAQLFALPVIHAQRVGVEDGLVFSGGSEVVGPDGTVLAQAPLLDDATLDVSFEPGPLLERARASFPVSSADDFPRILAELRRIEAAWVTGADAP